MKKESNHSGKYAVQVESKEHYTKNYDNLKRFMSYYFQIESVTEINPSTILEIGVGNKMVSDYLKKSGYSVTTCDFDRRLKPDHVADVRKLPFKNRSFDLIMICEVLEHIPWDEVDTALEQLHRVTKKYVLVSVPTSVIAFELILQLPFLNKLFSMKRHFIDVSFQFGTFYRPIKFKGEHYWELGRKGFSFSKVRRKIKKRFKIIKEFKPTLNSNQYFYILEKK